MAKKPRRSNKKNTTKQYISDANACLDKNKTPYNSQQEALSMIEEISQIRPGLELKTYFCTFCKHWHLAKTRGNL